MSEDTDKGEGRIEKLTIVQKGQNRYLVNGSDTPIERLQYSTAAIGENYVSSVPTYELESIPPRSGAKIEEIDPYEGGALIWQISEVDWADGTEYRGTAKRFEKEASVEWETVERERTEIGEPNPPQMLDDEDEEEDLGVF
jgi:hypothetical protein